MDNNSNEQLIRVEDKIDKLHEKLDGVIITQVAQAKDIAHHIARTDDLQKITTTLNEKYIQAKGAIKILCWIAGSATFTWSLLQLITFFRH